MGSSETSVQAINVPVLLWRRMIIALKDRGLGRRESGAFLLGEQSRGRARVTAFVCFDDLDPDCYQNGVILFHASGYAALWKLCRERKLQLLCDVHTHPGSDVRQSPIDERHPMVPTKGHGAIVVPHFAHTSWWSLKQIGIYEYRGEDGWRAYPPSLPERRVRLSLS